MDKRGIFSFFSLGSVGVFLVLLSGLILTGSGFLTGQVIFESAGESSARVDPRVFEVLEDGETVRVIVSVKEGNERVGLFGLRSVDRRSLAIQNLGEEKVKRKLLDNNLFVAEFTLEDIEKLKDDGRVDYVEYDYPVKTLLDDSVPLINATSTWNLQSEGLNLTGQGKTVCVIDTGIDYTHPDLGGCTEEEFLAGNCSKVVAGYDFGENDNNPMDVDGHGTHVAGIVGANGSIKGVAPDSKLVAIKVFDDQGGGNSGMIIDGITWCTNNATAFNISVITMSLGLCSGNPCESILRENYCDDEFTSLRNAINNAVAENISVTVATGNDADTGKVGVPACIENSTRIGSTTKGDSISSFSNRWNLTMLIAPGGTDGGSASCTPGSSPSNRICSTYLSQGYRALSGTSMAAPHMAGAIAILNQYFELTERTKTPSEIFEIFNSTGKQINDTGNGLNYSRIDLHGAILFIDEAPKINFVNPTEENNSFMGRDYVQVNVTAEDINLDTITIFLYNETEDLINSTSGTESFLFVNFSGLSEGIYYFNATANDTESNGNSTQTRIVNLTRPILEITRPKNETYFSNESLELRFSVVSEGETWFNLNGAENETITGNSSVSFNATEGQHTIYLFSNNTLGKTELNVTFVVNLSKFEVKFGNYSGEGNTTDFRRYSFEEIQNLSEVVLEKISFGKIRFNEPINLTNINSSEVDIDSYVNVSFNKIELNSTTLSNFNKSAELTLRNLTFTNPRILRDGSVCPESICTFIGYSGGNLVFNVTHFTIYSSEETPAPESSGGGGGGGGSSGGTQSEASFVPLDEDEPEEILEEIIYVMNEIGSEMNFSVSTNSVLEFEIGTYDNEGNLTSTSNHSIEIINIFTDHVNLTIRSDPINITLFTGESTRLNLTNPDFYDLFLKLDSISENQESANITVRNIWEEIDLEKKVLTEREILILSFVAAVLLIIAAIFLGLRQFRKKNQESQQPSQGE